MLSVILGLGANLGEPERAFSRAVTDLAVDGEIVSVSHCWQTRPVGPTQPDYVNAAVLLRWPGSPERLLASCRTIEAAAGRDRSTEPRWGPRTLDLDLLIARALVWRSPALVLPHPRFHERAFALAPAAELAPDWIHPLIGRSIASLARDVRAGDPDAIVSRGARRIRY